MKQLTLLLFLGCSGLALACDCDSTGKFLTVAPASEVVALVKIIRYTSFTDIYDKGTPVSMEVEVIELFKGQETRRLITIWGDNGFLCRPYLSQFAIGEHYVMALSETEQFAAAFDHLETQHKDYGISICGDYWLNVRMNAQLAIGGISDQQQEMGLAELSERLK